MSNYLVTGGAGFIGSHLARLLLAHGHHVRVLDDLSTGSRAAVPAGAELIEGDICNAEAVRTAFDGMDGCFHLAAIASVPRSVADWVAVHRINLTGSITVFDEARRRGNLPVVFASSAAVYGIQAELPITERVGHAPLTPYGADKAGCELHAQAARAVYGTPVVGLRLFNVYGPGQPPDSPYSGVISIFVDRALRGLPLTIYGDGQQSRDFIYVGDVVRFFAEAMRRASACPPAINACTGRATSLLQLTDTIEQVTGWTRSVRFAPPRAGDIYASVGSPEHAGRTLGLRASVGIQEGLRALVQSLQPSLVASEMRHPRMARQAASSG